MEKIDIDARLVYDCDVIMYDCGVIKQKLYMKLSFFYVYDSAANTVSFEGNTDCAATQPPQTTTPLLLQQMMAEGIHLVRSRQHSSNDEGSVCSSSHSLGQKSAPSSCSREGRGRWRKENAKEKVGVTTFFSSETDAAAAARYDEQVIL
jgi:hypothetical protein